MKEVFGDLKSLRASDRLTLEKLGTRRCNPAEILDTELAKRTARVAHDVGLQIGLLIGRDGRVEHVIAGSKDRIYLPDLGRFRLDEARLRRLRLVVFLPDGERKLVEQMPTLATFASSSRGKGSRALLVPEMAGDLLTDLEKLRLDLVLVVAVMDSGAAGPCTLAYLQASERRNGLQHGIQQSGARPRSIEFQYAPSVRDLDISFDALIEDLEMQFRATQTTSRAVTHDGAVLVGAYSESAAEAEAHMDELCELARTAGITILDTVMQRRRKLDPKTVLGKGKIEELVLHCLDLGAELLIFDRELSPGQLRSIANLTELKVIDRSMLILDIFAQRARSSEGRLQVELAQLRYSLPRLTDKDSGLSRLSGGIGGRGPGETKLEITRRRARDRITDLEKRIDNVARQRGLRRERRQERGVPVIAIVGYTNAGKSTLLNALTKGDVFVENKLFATLDPASRRMRFPNEKEVVFVDTVGFIRELPKELVAAFRATLEEVTEADLLVHVVDAHDPDVRKRIEVVETTLADLKLGDKPKILALNKIDLLSEIEGKSLTQALDALPVSALKRLGFETLILNIQDALSRSFQGQDPGHFLSSSSI